MKIGYHCEGHDHLVLHCLICGLRGIPEGSATLLRTGLEPCNDGQVRKLLPVAIKRLSLDRTSAVVVARDNDGCGGTVCHKAPGNCAKMRHSHHAAAGEPRDNSCRWCQLAAAVESAKVRHGGPTVAPPFPPVVICVPVETIEAWLLIARGLVENIPEYLGAEHWPGGCRPAGPKLKEMLYGRPGAGERLVNGVALPLLHRLPDVQAIGDHSESFRQFADQVVGLP